MAAPMPAAGPLIDPITGFGISIIFLKVGKNPLFNESFVLVHVDSRSVRSAPAVKPFPAPVITTTRISLSSLRLRVAS